MLTLNFCRVATKSDKSGRSIKVSISQEKLKKWQKPGKFTKKRGVIEKIKEKSGNLTKFLNTSKFT